MAEIRCARCQHVNAAGEETCAKCHAKLPKVEIHVNSPQPREGSQELMFYQHQLVAGRYTVLNIIGRGGMGCIYKVHDNTLNEEVALKTLLPQFARDKVVVERFFNEARIARQLSHQNIVRVHDIGTTEGVIYISMEYLKGKSLRAYMENLMPGQRLPLKSVLRVFDELCGALEYAHHYTIHRDIKPENVMITQDGRVKLMDFGISKLMASTQMTQASMVMGTPFYMSPEQLRNSASVDARADVYSVGVMLYEVLTGNVPVGMAKPVSEIRPDLPPDIDPIVRKCIEQEPEHRYQSATELRDAIREARAIVDPEFDPNATSKLYRTTTAAGQRNRLVGWALVVALAVLMAVGLWQAESQRRDRMAHARDAGSSVVPAGRAPAGSLAEFGDLIEQAMARAQRRAADNPYMQPLLDRGATLWAAAQDRADPQQAWQALQQIAGVALAPEGMAFVPAGRVTLTTGTSESTFEVDAYFIDRNETTVGEFRNFAAAQSPPWDVAGRPVQRALQAGEDVPITGVTYYDALAYAAAQGKDLPTEAQWARAAYGADGAPDTYPWDRDGGAIDADAGPLGNLPGQGYEHEGYVAPVQSFPLSDITDYGVYDMAGNVSEWTRTPFDALGVEPGNVPEPGFGVTMAVRGGNYNMDLPLYARDRCLFEQSDARIGFRCVKSFPSDLAQLRSALNAAPTP